MAFGIFDGHCDTLTTLQEDERLYDAERNFNLKQAERYEYFTQILAIWVDAARDQVEEKVEKYIARFYEELSKNPAVKQIKTKKDIESFKKGINVILAIEGGGGNRSQSCARLKNYTRRGFA